MRTTLKSFEPVSSGQRSTPVTSAWVISFILDLLKGCRMRLCADSTSSRSVQNGVRGDHLASKRLSRPLPKLKWEPANNSRRFRTRPDRWGTPRAAVWRRPLMMVPPTSTSTMFPSNPMPTPHVNPMPTPTAAPMPLTVPEPMNLDIIVNLREELHAYIGECWNDRLKRQDN